MTRPARIQVGDPKSQPMVPFPPPGHDFGPRRIADAASYILEDDYGVNLDRIYCLIGFDAAALAKYLRLKKKEEALIADGRLPPLSKVQRSLRPVVRAVGLELTTGLFLACLDSPARTACPCGVYIDDEGRPVPMAPAGQGLADARADYEGFSVIAEVTIGKKTRREPLRRQYNSAVSHIATILAERNARRGYCLMVSRAKLSDEQVPVLIVEAQEKLERNHGPGNVRILAFGIEEMAHVADQLGRLYWTDEEARPLTAADLGDILDTLHDGMMAWISSGEPFPEHWAARQFEKLLRAHAWGRPVKTLFDRPAEQAGQAAGPAS